MIEQGEIDTDNIEAAKFENMQVMQNKRENNEIMHNKIDECDKNMQLNFGEPSNLNNNVYCTE